MAVRFFGQFLLENRVIDARQLLAAIAHQEKHNLKFGDTAIQLGFLDRAKLEQVFAKQRKEDIKSGEAAVKLGFMTAEQVEQVLRAQKNSHVMIGEALVKTGALSAQELEKQVARFKEDQEPFQASVAVPEKSDPTGLGGPAVDLTGKFLLRLANINAKLSEITTGDPPGPIGRTLTGRIGFTGSVQGELALRASEPICARIAGSMLGEPVAPEKRELVVDAVCEFLNLVGGNLSAAIARASGRRLELGAPKAGELPRAGKGEHLLASRFNTPDGPVDFVVLAKTAA